MIGVRPCLTFNGQAEEAINLYVSVIRNSRILSLSRYQADGLVAEGQVIHAAFELDGREFTAMDGGPSFTFSEGFSLAMTCDDQDELDRIWNGLIEGGGEEGRCGWCKDRFGVSWQVVPAALAEMMGDPKSGDTANLVKAMLTMNKLDIAALRAAYEGAIVQ